MKKEKTIIEWLRESLNADQLKEAENEMTYAKVFEIKSSPESALSAAFHWGSSARGFKYWNKVYDGLVLLSESDAQENTNE